ncbi:LysR family transcriptional regulator [Bacillus wiedmannii]|uniref:LysR family transcriptional regulator n=2 Tax=Bacillus wiedmannii TaxID=1890302 RepID=UPI001F096695|nr:LysR family transcriptional regulator [Bacillus wiedmannii]
MVRPVGLMTACELAIPGVKVVVLVRRLKELGSFTEAAKKNRMTVPTISQSIAQLENELGVTLFTRSRKGTNSTIEGKIVIQHAITVLKTINKMKSEISLFQSENQGNIVIATIPGMISQIIDTTIKFRKDYPHVNIQLVEGDSRLVLNYVQNGHADLGFVSFKAEKEEEFLTWEPLVKGETLLVVNKNSHLRFKQSISGDELEDEMIVLYNDPYLKKITQDILPTHLWNKVSLITNNIEGIFRMIIHENAVTIGPDYIVHSLPPEQKNEVISVSIDKYKTIPYYLWKVTRKNEKASGLINQFTEQLFSNLSNPHN